MQTVEKATVISFRKSHDDSQKNKAKESYLNTPQLPENIFIHKGIGLPTRTVDV